MISEEGSPAAPPVPDDQEKREDDARAERAKLRYAHLPGNMRMLLERYPALGMSQHPRIVHFPMAAAVLSPFFNLAYLLSGRKSLGETAFHLNLIGAASVPPVALSGAASWWITYRAHCFRNIKVKVALSPLMMAGFTTTTVMRWRNPAIMEAAGTGRRVYMLLSLSMPLMAGVMGYYGGKIVHRH
ncbi:MAG: hypothetical protein PHP28_04790 [Actinomycetota bacterium]|nr:hypothetical protein [Actinomycetota bacterium]MDD5665932.1 hypothetical protein [Actinomycetota bacterium]